MIPSRFFGSLFKNDRIKDAFNGCMVGALIGDCYGKPYKLSEDVSKAQLQNYFDKLDGEYFKAPFKPYSVNTAFSNCVAQSLTSEGSLNVTDIAKRFAKEFFNNPYRDYGSNISKIMLQLRGGKFSNPCGHAREQYFGIGSFGNKASTRVAPIVGFFADDIEAMINAVKEVSKITHSHKLAIDGAILQSWAIRVALSARDGNTLNPSHFLEELMNHIKEFDKDDDDDLGIDSGKYMKQMILVRRLLEKSKPTEEEVINVLGHGKIALYSVPTATYCFLRSFQEIPGIDTQNKFRRAVQYAVALGGDADTIASLTGALAGAAYGLSSIGASMQRHCEGISSIKEFSESIINCRDKNR